MTQVAAMPDRMAPPAPAPPAWSSGEGNHSAWRRWKNRAIIGLMALGLFLAIVPLLSLLATLLFKGLPHISSEFLLALPKPRDEQGGGVVNAILGSLALLAVATAASVPLGLAVGIYLAQRGGSRLGVMVRILLDVMSGIPAIIVGVFIYTVVARKNGAFSLHIGYSMLAGGLALGMIMLPLFARMSEEALRQIPTTVEEAGLGLGLPRRRVILRIILRAAMPTVLTAGFLALSRVAGEAAPLLFTAFGTPTDRPTSLFDKCWSLPVALYNYFDQGDIRLAQAWSASLVLVIMILMIRLGMNFYTHRRYGRASGGAQA